MSDFVNEHNGDFEAFERHLETLLAEIEAYPDESFREKVFEMVQVLLEFNRAALQRVLEIILENEGGRQIQRLLLKDPVIETVLRGFGLAEIDLRAKVSEALNDMRLILLSHGIKAEVVGVREDVAQVRLHVYESNFNELPTELQREVEKQIVDYVPEVSGVEITIHKAAASPAQSTFIPLEQLLNSKPEPPKDRKIPVLHLYQLQTERLKPVSVDETNDVLMCHVQGKVYGFKNRCSGPEGQPLHTGLLEGAILTCPCHGYRFDLRDGRCMEQPDLDLEALQVTVEDQTVSVTL